MPTESSQEIVILIRRDGKPYMMAWKNDVGEIEYMLVKRARWDDHVSLHNADVKKTA